MTSGLPPDAAAPLRGARSSLAVAGFVVLVGGTVLLSGVLVQAPGRTRHTRGRANCTRSAEATVGHRPEESPCGEHIRARRRLCNGWRRRLSPGARAPSPAPHPSSSTPATTWPIAVRVGRSG